MLVRLVWITVFQKSRSISRMWLIGPAQAPLFTRMSTLPQVSSTCLNIASTSSLTPTSQVIGSTSPPACLITSAVCWSGSGRRAVMTTLAPSCESRFAMPAPMPRLPPVTIATLPSRPMSAFLPLYGRPVAGPAGLPLVGVCDAQDGGLFEGPPDDLEPDRQPGHREAARHRQGRQPEHVEEAGAAEQLLACLRPPRFRDGRGQDARRRRQQHVDPLEQHAEPVHQHAPRL